MRQCHLTSAHTLTFSFTYQLCKQKYLLKHVPPETRKCFCGSDLMHERRTARTLHDAKEAHIFQTIFQNKPFCFGTRRSHEFESRKGHWLQVTSSFHILPSSSPHSTSCPVHHHIPHPAKFITTFHILPSSSQHSTLRPVHHHIPHPAQFITTFHILSSSSPHSTSCPVRHHIPHSTRSQHHNPHPAQFITTFHLLTSSSPQSTSCQVHHHIPHPAQFITASRPVRHHIPHPAQFITTFHILPSSSPHSTSCPVHHHIPHPAKFITTFQILPSSLLLTILPSDDTTLQVTDAQIFHRCRAAISKFYAPDGWREASSILRAPNISVATPQKWVPGICIPLDRTARSVIK